MQLYATTGTCDYLKKSDIPATEVSSLTQHPDLLGGRVKTLHPKVFGGLLYRSQEAEDMDTLAKYNIPQFDMLIVNLYPFEAALEAKESEDGLVEKIDIGGVSLLRAAAKNFKEIWVISAPTQYALLKNGWKKRAPALLFPCVERLHGMLFMSVRTMTLPFFHILMHRSH